jgi:DNA-binding NtrC family response regulator
MHPRLQAKLLRAIQEREIDRVGGTQPIKVDIRLIATSNRDLEAEARKGTFREDLYFRLNVLAVPVPPLRERRTDIPALAAHFLSRLGPVHGRADASLDPAALHLFESYAWPGNVRELKNAIEHGLIFGKESLLEPGDFPEIIRAAPHEAGSIGPLRSLEDLERDAIKATLEATRYKIGRAAEILGISRKTLLEKRKKYQLLE